MIGGFHHLHQRPGFEVQLGAWRDEVPQPDGSEQGMEEYVQDSLVPADHDDLAAFEDQGHALGPFVSGAMSTGAVRTHNDLGSDPLQQSDITDMGGIGDVPQHTADRDSNDVDFDRDHSDEDIDGDAAGTGAIPAGMSMEEWVEFTQAQVEADKAARKSAIGQRAAGSAATSAGNPLP